MSDKDQHTLLIEESATFVVDLVEKKTECPYCGWNNDLESNKEKALTAHLKKAHPSKCLLAYERQLLHPQMAAPADTETPLLEHLGLEVTDDTQQYSLLHIDPQLKREVESDGSKLRWASPDKALHWRNQGAEPVAYAGPEHTRTQQSTEDGTTRSNELILMRVPAVTVNNREKQKRRKSDNNLVGKAEDLNRSPDDTSHEAFKAMLERGVDRSVAQQVADSLSRGKESGHLRDAGEEQGYIRVETQQGIKTLRPG